MDVTALLGRIISAENTVSQLKTAVERQAKNNEDFQSIAQTLDERVRNVELRGKNDDTMPLVISSSHLVKQSNQTVPNTVEMSKPTATQPLIPDEAAVQQTPWSKIVRDGHRRRVVPENNSPNSAEGTHRQSSAKTMKKKPMGIVGTATGGNVRVVRSKMVNVFATRFDPDMEASDLVEYLKDRLGRNVECTKIATERKRFSSFHIRAECNTIDEMYAPDLWPEGAYVRRYYEPRKSQSAVNSGNRLESDN